eukprot:6202567-Pleurochrysis_carterae.AAC.1
MLKLQERAKHSNFGQCNECADIKEKWAAFRKSCSQYTVSEVAVMKHTLFQHLQDMRAERRAAMKMHQGCAGHRDWLFKHDDKCGSIYTHLPSPKGANFGCSAFFASLLRNLEIGTLGSVVYRQTDGGSDNDAVITH